MVQSYSLPQIKFSSHLQVFWALFTREMMAPNATSRSVHRLRPLIAVIHIIMVIMKERCGREYEFSYIR